AVPDRLVARELGLGAGGAAFVLERLRLVGGRPMSFQGSHLPASIGQDGAKIDLVSAPLHPALAKLGLAITTARETVPAGRLDAPAARELGCRAGAPAFRSDRVSLGADGTPIVYDRVFIPGDRFRITRQLHYNGSTPKEPSE